MLFKTTGWIHRGTTTKHEPASSVCSFSVSRSMFLILAQSFRVSFSFFLEAFPQMSIFNSNPNTGLNPDKLGRIANCWWSNLLLLYKRMDELMWARMKIKPSKSWRLYLRRGVRNDSTVIVGERKFPSSETPIKTLGRQYMAEFSDKQMGRVMMKRLSEILAEIDQSQLPGSYKVRCYQFMLYRRVMCPLKTSEIP